MMHTRAMARIPAATSVGRERGDWYIRRSFDITGFRASTRVVTRCTTRGVCVPLRFPARPCRVAHLTHSLCPHRLPAWLMGAFFYFWASRESLQLRLFNLDERLSCSDYLRVNTDHVNDIVASEVITAEEGEYIPMPSAPTKWAVPGPAEVEVKRYRDGRLEGRIIRGSARPMHYAIHFKWKRLNWGL